MLIRKVASFTIFAMILLLMTPLFAWAEEPDAEAAQLSAAESGAPAWPKSVHYLALGDSLAAGVTADVYFRIDRGYADYLKQYIEGAGYLAGYDKHFAVPGYTSADVLSAVKTGVARTVAGDLPGVREAVANADLITISAGANDFLNKMQIDAATGDVSLANPDAIAASVTQNVYLTLEAIKSINPNAKVYVMGYYNSYPYMPDYVQPQLLGLLTYLNGSLKQAVGNRAEFIATDDVITSDKKLMYLPNPRNVHPSPAGYEAIARQFWKKLIWNGTGALTASNITERTVRLSWTPSMVNTYRIYNGTEVLQTVYGSVYTDITGLRSGTVYTLKAEAGDAAGIWSADGPQVTFRTRSSDDNPPASTGPSSSGGTTTGGTGGGSVNPLSPADTGAGAILLIGASDVKQETGKDGSVEDKVVLDRDKLSQAFGLVKSKPAGLQTVTVEIKSTAGTLKVHVPNQVLAAALTESPIAVLSLKTDGVTYNLPIGIFKNAADGLASAGSDITVIVTIRKVTGPALDALKKSAEGIGAALLLPYAYEFQITAMNTSGATRELNRFGAIYAERKLTVAQTLDPAQTAAVTYDEATGELTYVPALFTKGAGTTEVNIKSTHNSLYTLVSANTSFADIQEHWAQADIKLLASKLLVKGVSDNRFAPDQQITRAEFAALLVRALGVAEHAEAAAKYADVGPAEWFTGSVGAASEAGLVEGFEDGKFRPSERITREQMAVMLSKAVKFAGLPVAVSEADRKAKLAALQDGLMISPWAADAVAQGLSAGLLQGTGEAVFGPKDNATRAQAAAILKRMLISVSLMN